MSAAIAVDFPSAVPRQMQVVRILSLSPFLLTKQMCLGKGFYTFTIPAQRRNQYHILTVSDSYQNILSGWDSIQSEREGPELRQAPVPAKVLADSLVAEWSRTMAPVGGTGVRVLSPDIEEGSPEFKAILNELTGQVRELAEWAIRDAGDKFGTNQAKYISNGFHRTLALWLMGDEGARAIPWYNAQAINELKKCIACGDSINATAKVCKSCGTDLVDYFQKYKMGEADDPIIHSFVQTVQRPAPTEPTRAAADSPAAPTFQAPAITMPAEVRVLLVNLLNGEQKAEMTQQKGQDARDAYLASLIPEFVKRNPKLRDDLVKKGYVVPNAE